MSIGTFLSDGAEYLAPGIQRAGSVTMGDAGQYLIGNRPGAVQIGAAKDAKWLANRIPGVNPAAASKIGRFAGKALPMLSAAGNVMDVADIVAGDESLGNKAMDAAGMGLGGTVGFFMGGPLGASMGASVGKMGSDGLQWLFGDKKTPSQRKLEESLLYLNGGVV